MLRAQIPKDETRRLKALASLRLLHTNPEERFDRVTLLACRMFGVPIAMISLVSADRQWCKSIQGLQLRDVPRDVSLCAHAILRKDPLVIPDTHATAAFADNPLVTGEPSMRFYAGCPLFFEGQPVGTLAIVDREPREFGTEQVQALRSLADIIENEFSLDAMNMTQSRLIEELEDTRKRELLDALTGIWNRRGIEELLPRELSRAARGADEVALMLIDIDHLPQIAERYGHESANTVLVHTAKRLRGCVRPHDILGKYSSDEFLVFLSKCDRDNAQMIGQRMISAINDSPIPTVRGDVVTSLSIGIYSMQDVAGRSMGQIIDAADQALYVARENGRNRVVHY